ncbi:hypothetical protein ACLOJK_024012 [Asimina triloba]
MAKVTRPLSCRLSRKVEEHGQAVLVDTVIFKELMELKARRKLKEIWRESYSRNEISTPYFIAPRSTYSVLYHNHQGWHPWLSSDDLAANIRFNDRIWPKEWRHPSPPDPTNSTDVDRIFTI